MVEYELNYPYLIMLKGGIVILFMFVKSAFTSPLSVHALLQHWPQNGRKKC